MEVGVSARHLSFLETGRSKPGKTLIYELAQVFGLSHRDTSNMLAAAGYFPDATVRDLSAPELRWLRKSLVLSLQDLEPVPAWIADPCGNILMVNRGWIQLMNRYLEDKAPETELNAYHFYLGQQWLRKHLLDWEDLACALLLHLQQEALLTEDETSRAALDELLALPDIPGDWQRRGAGVPYSHSFPVRVKSEDGTTHSYLAVNNTVGATPYVASPRLILSTLHPMDHTDHYSREAQQDLQHPLLYSEVGEPSALG